MGAEDGVRSEQYDFLTVRQSCGNAPCIDKKMCANGLMFGDVRCMHSELIKRLPDMDAQFVPLCNRSVMGVDLGDATNGDVVLIIIFVVIICIACWRIRKSKAGREVRLKEFQMAKRIQEAEGAARTQEMIARAEVAGAKLNAENPIGVEFS